MSVPSGRPWGVNAIASWESINGLTEAARRTILALLDAGVDLAIEDLDFGAPRNPGRLPAQFDKLPAGRPYDIDLCFINVNELQLISDNYLRKSGNYLIAFWFWELPAIPKAVQTQLQRVDEIWVASSFVRDTFAQYTSAHIEVAPCVVEPRANARFSWARHGVPSNRCVFFYNFDADSTFARKNPWGFIEAYRRAFSREERERSTHLVIKTINLHRYDEGKTTLLEETRSVGGTVIDEDLTAEEMAALMKNIDIYVSLHRAEGFGLGIAEAMYFGKPVVATAYSGNIDFTDTSNSCQVGYWIRPIFEGELRFNPNAEFIYEPGMIWAEPDIEQAARWMRLLYLNATLRNRIGEAGRKTVRERMRSDSVGEAIRKRLTTISDGRLDSVIPQNGLSDPLTASHRRWFVEGPR